MFSLLTPNFLIGMFFMILTGFFDGQAFSRVPQIWNLHGINQFYQILKLIGFFNLAVLTFIISTYFLHQQGVENAVIVTLIWFIMTIIGVAIISGSFFPYHFLTKLSHL